MDKTEMMNHTKEPWKADLRLGCFAIYPNGQDRNCLECARDDAIVYQNGRGDKSSPDGYRYLTAEQEANAKRIVACVNACAGITNEALENGVIKEAMELFWRVSDKAILNENNQMTYKGDIVFASDKEEDV